MKGTLVTLGLHHGTSSELEKNEKTKRVEKQQLLFKDQGLCRTGEFRFLQHLAFFFTLNLSFYYCFFERLSKTKVYFFKIIPLYSTTMWCIIDEAISINYNVPCSTRPFTASNSWAGWRVSYLAILSRCAVLFHKYNLSQSQV